MGARSRTYSTREDDDDVHYSFTYDGDRQPMTLDARSLTLPSLAIIAIVGAFVWATWFYSQDQNSMSRRIDETVASVERLASSVKTLAEALKVRAEQGYTQAEHEVFCVKAELANPGWRCPEGDRGTHLRKPDIDLSGAAATVSREMEELERRAKEKKAWDERERR